MKQRRNTVKSNTHCCPCCKEEFDLEKLIHSPEIELIGMSFIGEEADSAYYFFQHDKPDCGSSFVVSVDKFHSKIEEYVPDHNLSGCDCCDRHCLTITDVRTCKQECHFAPYRRFLEKMIEWKSSIKEVTP